MVGIRHFVFGNSVGRKQSLSESVNLRCGAVKDLDSIKCRKSCARLF